MKLDSLFIELCNAQPESEVDAVQKQATRTPQNVVFKGNLSILVSLFLVYICWIQFSFCLLCFGLFYLQYQPIRTSSTTAVIIKEKYEPKCFLVCLFQIPGL